MALTVAGVTVVLLMVLWMGAALSARAASHRVVAVTVRSCSMCGSSFTAHGTAPVRCPRCDGAGRPNALPGAAG